MRKNFLLCFSLIRTLTGVKNLVNSKSAYTAAFSLIRTFAKAKNLDSVQPANVAGFSLIELLVVISIIGILSAVGLASYISFNQRQTVDQMARKIVQDLRMAQSLATNNQKTVEIIDAGCPSLDGYSFSITDGGYSIFPTCLSNGTVIQLGPIKQETLPIIFDFDGTTTISFKVLRRGIVGPNTITFTAFNRTKIIDIDSGGSIKLRGETAE